MNTKEAKDFLVAQAAEQAALDHVPLSDLEKEMMYFTESDTATCPDPIGLHDRFEAECDSAEYETKMRQLLRHAYKRLKAENPERKRTWDEAIRILKQGDHYVLILSGDFGLGGIKGSSEHRVRDFFLMLLIGIAIVVAILAVAIWRAR